MQRVLVYRFSAAALWIALGLFWLLHFHGWVLLFAVVYAAAAAYQVMSWFWFDK